MVKVVSLEDIRKHYKEGATVAPTRYKDAVSKATWKDRAASADAESLFAAKMTEAIVAGRRKKAIERKTDEDWRKPAVELGSTRIGTGMTAAIDKQSSGYAPYRSALEGVTLPSKTADPMANIDARVKPVVSVLVAKKKEILG